MNWLRLIIFFVVRVVVVGVVEAAVVLVLVVVTDLEAWAAGATLGVKRNVFGIKSQSLEIISKQNKTKQNKLTH